jgi:hypothetical protein
MFDGKECCVLGRNIYLDNNLRDIKQVVLLRNELQPAQHSYQIGATQDYHDLPFVILPVSYTVYKGNIIVPD